MARFTLALAGLAAAGAALLGTPEPAHADLDQARQWMERRFQRGADPGVGGRQIVDRPSLRRTQPVRRMAAQRPPARAVSSRPAVRRVAARPRPVYAPPVVQQVVYQPYAVYYRPVVRRIYVVQW